jgi:dTDP-4-dehydrorhamnose 3,5-epimerase
LDGFSEESAMQVTPTAIPDVLLVEPRVFKDERGFFLESFQARKYAAAGIHGPMVQDNHSGSRQGVLRGLHYQVRQPQHKLVSVIAGEIFDIAVDIRRSSPTFRQWVGVNLSAQNRRQLWIPAGFAHGFYVVSEWAEVMYKVNDFYNPEAERTLVWNDPQLAIAWPLANGAVPVLSLKDAQGKTLDVAELFD